MTLNQGEIYKPDFPNLRTFHNTTGTEIAFYKIEKCRNSQTTSYSLALFLSLFLGFLGADLFYLGYPTFGVLKCLTFGLGGLWWLVDILLIVFQILKPADGSEYVIDWFGPIMVHSDVEL